MSLTVASLAAVGPGAGSGDSGVYCYPLRCFPQQCEGASPQKSPQSVSNIMPMLCFRNEPTLVISALKLVKMIMNERYSEYHSISSAMSRQLNQRIFERQRQLESLLVLNCIS